LGREKRRRDKEYVEDGFFSALRSLLPQKRAPSPPHRGNREGWRRKISRRLYFFSKLIGAGR
jgi:hypothetical protein